MSLRLRRKIKGTANMPTTNHSTRKKHILSTEPIISPPSGLEPLAKADSITIITMASTSSSMSTLMTGWANCCWRRPMSVNALYIMVVELMASIPPRKMQSMRFHPNPCPTIMPSVIIAKMMVSVVMTGATPIFMIFLNEKSKPKEKSKNITPMSAHVFMSVLSITDIV